MSSLRHPRSIHIHTYVRTHARARKSPVRYEAETKDTYWGSARVARMDGEIEVTRIKARKSASPAYYQSE